MKINFTFLNLCKKEFQYLKFHLLDFKPNFLDGQNA